MLEFLILNNDQKSFENLNFIGDDYWAINFNKKIIQDYNKSKANIVLCHNPDICDLNV